MIKSELPVFKNNDDNEIRKKKDKGRCPVRNMTMQHD